MHFLNTSHKLYYNNTINELTVIYKEGGSYMIKPMCPECGGTIDERSMILECEYCLSKKEE
ncbi:hypothetical protein GCM10008983_17030 [Lentibacillus halophilus]|uniref:YhfH-like protein n=1 Tax=Lentibacillus halophilus TaxID=295065 RepID=A0ABP3J3S0_9BACI